MSTHSKKVAAPTPQVEGRFRVEVVVRVVDNENGQVVDHSGYTDMTEFYRSRGRDPKPFFGLSSAVQMKGFSSTPEATDHMNKIWNILSNLKTIQL